MIQREIKRAMYANLKEQTATYKLLDACENGAAADAVRFYENKLSELDEQLDDLIQAYEDCIPD